MTLDLSRIPPEQPTDPDGITIDAIVRYLADKPAETLKVIATLVTTLAPERLTARSVRFAAAGEDNALFTFLAAQPGAERLSQPHPDDAGKVIETVYQDIGGYLGVRFAVTRLRALGPR